VRVHLGLGSNLGDRDAHLAGALRALRAADPDLAVSPLYETAPVGGPPGQGPYLNCVVRFETDLTPPELLALTRSIEAAAGRTRGERWGARTLDVDVLVVEGVEQDDPELVLPHPRMSERAFVLAPLEDLDPDLVPEGWRDALGGPERISRMVRRVRGAP